MQVDGQVVSADGTRIAYTRTGSGPLLVLVNGALGYRGHHGMADLAAELAGSFSVIDYDRRGRGASSNSLPYAVEREIEDIAALLQKDKGPAYLYGFSSGAALALLATASGKVNVAKLALLEPPYGEDSADGRREHAEFSAAMHEFAMAGQRAAALDLFLGGMLPPDMLDEMKQGPEWPLMLGVAHTLDYDCQVLGDGAAPKAECASVKVPALVLVGAESPDFKHTAARDVANEMPDAKVKTIDGEMTMVPATVLAPLLKRFFLV